METQTLVQDSKLKEFFVDQLKDIYWAEKKLVKTLPKMEEAATTPQLKDAFRNHLICNHIMVQALMDGMKKEKYGRIINIISICIVIS